MMEGFNVLAPMGWDAFGLPAENAALTQNIHPAVWTRDNIARMKAQFYRWGVVYDWSRELASYDPAYYRWTQWLFIQLFNEGLAYRKGASVNWCPSCETSSPKRLFYRPAPAQTSLRISIGSIYNNHSRR